MRMVQKDQRGGKKWLKPPLIKQQLSPIRLKSALDFACTELVCKIRSKVPLGQLNVVLS